jgi:hypothetical protein
MYLDTDCILALIKESDWLKEPVQKRLLKEKGLCTSVLSVIECKLIFAREEKLETSLLVEDKITKEHIKLLPLDEKVLTLSNDLQKRYPILGIFDSIHIGTAIINKERILSSDHLFPQIAEISVENPLIDKRK